MLGQIESFDDKTQTGVIHFQDQYYEFHLDQWTSDDAPKAGDDVDFDHEDGQVTEVGLVGIYLKQMMPVKNRKLAGILGLLLGGAGVHRMYLGFWGMGIAQALVTYFTGGFGVVWGFIDGFLVITGHIPKDAKGRPLK
jgi:TM2 domain-containing membrane protein YozV